MALLVDRITFEDEEEAAPAEELVEPSTLSLSDRIRFEGDETPITPPAGAIGEARPVERDVLETARDAWMQGYSEAQKNIAQQTSLAFDETDEEKLSSGVRIKELERKAESYGPSMETMQELQEISNAETLGEAIDLMWKYPGAVGNVTVSSLGRFAPSLAATAGVTAATGGVAAPLMASTFVGSLAIEYGAVMDEVIREAGYDSADPTAWQRAVEDEEMLDRARTKGLKRGIPIAAVDALTMGIAGKILIGAKPTATSILSRSVAELGVQAGGGGAGEALAQIVDEGKVGKPGEVAMEAVAELGPGGAQVGIGYYGQKQQALRRQMAEQAKLEDEQIAADAALTPDFEIHPLTENMGAIDAAIEVAPPIVDEQPKDVPLEPDEQPVLPLDAPEPAPEHIRAWVESKIKEGFPNATDEEISAAAEAAQPPADQITDQQKREINEFVSAQAETTPQAPVEPAPTEPAPVAPEPVTTEPAPEEVQAPPEDLGWTAPTAPEIPDEPITPKPIQPRTELPGEPTDEITRDEVVAATEPVEPTGDAITTAEAFRTARPEFEGTILSFKPGDDRNGVTIPHYYGEIAETEDADGMPIDVVLNKDHDPTADTPVFIANQKDFESGEFRQHKVMAGFDDIAAAEQGYKAQFPAEGFGSIHELSAEEFQNWRDTGDHKVEYIDESGLVVAAVGKDGKLYTGEPGDLHFNIVDRYGPAIREKEGREGDTFPQVGYADAEGNFLTREEALKRVQKTSPDYTPFGIAAETKLDAMDYQEQVLGMDLAGQKADAEALDKAERNEAARIRQTETTRKNLQPSDTDDLITWVRKKGGLNMDIQSDIPAGRLKHLNQNNKMVGLPGIEQTGERGLSLAALTEAAWETGFIKANDDSLMIEALYQAESGPVYTAVGDEAALQASIKAEQDAQFEAEEDAYQTMRTEQAAEMAALVEESQNEYNQLNPETARLMALASDLDHDMMVDIASRDVPDEEVQGLLQEFIDEQSRQTTTDTGEAPATEAGERDQGAEEGQPAAAETGVTKAETSYPRKPAVLFEPITDLTELSRYADNDFSAIDPYLMDMALEMTNLAIQKMNEAGYAFEEVLHVPPSLLPDYLSGPMSDVTQAGSSLVPLSRVLAGIKKGHKRAKPENVLDQLWRYTQALHADPFPDGVGFKEHITEEYPELAARLDVNYGFLDEEGQRDMLGKPTDEEDLQAIEDEKAKQQLKDAKQAAAQKMGTGVITPATAQSPDDIFADEQLDIEDVESPIERSDRLHEAARVKPEEFHKGKEYLGDGDYSRETYQWVEAMLDSTTAHPMIDGARVLMNRDLNNGDDFAVIEFEPAGHYGVQINTIQSSRTGKGNGRYALEVMMELADTHDVDLTLNPNAYGTVEGALSQEDLIAWYRRNDFVDMVGYTDMLIRAPIESRRQAEALKWPVPNENGVYAKKEGEANQIAFPALKSDKVEAIAYTLEISPDQWISAHDIDFRQGTMQGSFSPLMAQTTFDNQADAEIDALLKIKQIGLNVEKDQSTPSTDKQRKSGRKVANWVDQEFKERGYAPKDLVTLDQVLALSRQPTTESTPLQDIQLVAETDDATITHKATFWLDAIDERIESVNKLRTCT